MLTHRRTKEQTGTMKLIERFPNSLLGLMKHEICREVYEMSPNVYL